MDRQKRVPAMNRLILTIVCVLLIAPAACSPPPADVIDTGSVPTEPVSAIYLMASGQVPPIALATVLADIKAEFSLPVEMRLGAPSFTAVDRADLLARLQALRGDRPLSTVVVLLTDQPLITANKTISAIGVSVPGQRSLTLSTQAFLEQNSAMRQRDADDYSRLFFHLFAHTLGVGHTDDVTCLMQDWRNDPQRISEMPDKYCAPTLRVFGPLLNLRELPPGKIIP